MGKIKGTHGIGQGWCILVRILGMTAVVSLGGCSWPGAIWIVPGSTTHHLVFRVGRWRGDYKPIIVRSFEVDAHTTTSSTEWPPRWRPNLGATPPRLRQIEYGATQFERESLIRAQPLTPGTYLVTASFEYGRSAETLFTVNRNGTIVDQRAL